MRATIPGALAALLTVTASALYATRGNQEELARGRAGAIAVALIALAALGLFGALLVATRRAAPAGSAALGLATAPVAALAITAAPLLMTVLLVATLGFLVSAGWSIGRLGGRPGSAAALAWGGGAALGVLLATIALAL